VNLVEVGIETNDGCLQDSMKWWWSFKFQNSNDQKQ